MEMIELEREQAILYKSQSLRQHFYSYERRYQK